MEQASTKGEKPCGSTKLSGTILNVARDGLEEAKYMDVRSNPLGDAILESKFDARNKRQHWVRNPTVRQYAFCILVQQGIPN